VQPEGWASRRTFSFLVFTHLCAATQSGWFRLKRITIAKRPRASLREVREQLRKTRCTSRSRRRAARWPASVRGHMAYYAVPGNVQAVAAFHAQGDPAPAQDAAAPQSAHHDHLGADEPDRDPVATTRPRSCWHPYPNVRFDARTQARARCGNSRTPGPCAGPAARPQSTRPDCDPGTRVGLAIGAAMTRG